MILKSAAHNFPTISA